MAILLATPLPAALLRRFRGRGGWAEGACLALVLLLLFACVTTLIAETNNPFIYFRF